MGLLLFIRIPQLERFFLPTMPPPPAWSAGRESKACESRHEIKRLRIESFPPFRASQTGAESGLCSVLSVRL